MTTRVTAAAAATMVSSLAWCQFKSVLAVMLLSLLEGMAIGWASPGMEKMEAWSSSGEDEAPYRPSKAEVTLIISLFDIGVMLGSWTSTVVFAVAGRRQTILVGPVTLSAWVVLTAIGTSTPMLIVARMLAGCGMGIALSFSYMYVGEVASPHLRGPLSMVVTLLMPIGQLVAFLLGSNVPWLWQSVYPVPFIAAMVLCLVFLMQETPFYLASKGRAADMERSLRALRVGNSEESIQAEMKTIQETVKAREDSKGGSWYDVFQAPGAKKAAAIILVEASVMAVLGVTNVLAYTQQIFKFAKAENILDPVLSSSLVIVVEIVMISVAVFLIERLGRRLQMTTAALVASFSMAVLSAYFILLEDQKADMSSWKWVPLFGLLLYIACVGGGINSVPQVLMSEMLPQRAKVIIAPMCMTLMSLTSFGINYAFMPVGAAYGHWVMFLFFTCTNFVIALFTLFVVPETKGKSLAEVQDMLAGYPSRKERI